MRLPPLPALETPGPPVQLLSDRAALGVLRLSALLGHLGQWPGPVFHAVLAAWLASGPPDEGPLPEWCRVHLAELLGLTGIQAPAGNVWHAERFERAARTADDWWRRGIRVYSWGEAGCPPRQGPEPACPRVLFGRGDLPSGRPWVALFNSRKPRQLRPEDRWLVVLRHVLAELARLHATVAGSCGTLTYDLVSAFAQERGLPLVLATCDSLSERPGAAGCTGIPGDLPAGESQAGLLACAVQPLACRKADRLLCRDRLLAHLADLHVLLEIRDRGNLLQVLQDQQRYRPKRQWVLEALQGSAACRGNEALLREFPQWGSVIALGPDQTVEQEPGRSQVPFSKGAQGSALAAPGLGQPSSSPQDSDVRAGGVVPVTRRLSDFDWEHYLYHYTRPCPGPWPGQNYRDYLQSLLEGEASCAHDALDTLERILREGRVRGSNRLVRGVDAVVSWTSRPPRDLTEMRRWNRGLMRWTFEPYGIAVHRRELRRLGAKPAVYGPARLYQELKTDQRFRFQMWGSNGMSWKLEREWRLLGDLALHDDMDAFVFVPEEADAEQLIRQGNIAFPVVVLAHEKPIT